MNSILATFCAYIYMQLCRKASSHCERVPFIELSALYLVMFANLANVKCHKVHDSSVRGKPEITDSLKRLYLNSVNYSKILNSRLSQPISEVYKLSPLCSDQHSTISSRCMYLNTRYKTKQSNVFPSNRNERGNDSKMLQTIYGLRTFDRENRFPGSVSDSYNRETFSPKSEFPEDDINYMTFDDNDSRLLQFSNVANEVLLQAYRAKSPCIGSKSLWVRDEQDCSVFFVCARHQVAAVLTCPGSDVWSNSVTNCVPVRSVWDDCAGGSYESPDSVSKTNDFRNYDSSPYFSNVYPVTSSPPSYVNDSTLSSMKQILDKEDIGNHFKKGPYRSRSERRKLHDAGKSVTDVISGNKQDRYSFRRILTFPEQRPIFKRFPNDPVRRIPATTRKDSQRISSSSLPHIFHKMKRRQSNKKHKYGGTYVDLKHSLPQYISSQKRENPSVSNPSKLGKSINMKRYKLHKSKQDLHYRRIKMDNNGVTSTHNNKISDYNENFRKNKVDHSLSKHSALSKQHQTSGYDIRGLNHETSVSSWWIGVSTLSPAPALTQEGSGFSRNQVSVTVPEVSLSHQIHISPPGMFGCKS